MRTDGGGGGGIGSADNGRKAVRPYAGYIFDLDGTVYLGERLIPGAGKAIAALRARGARVIFLSNKPIQTREHYAEKLNRLGVPVEVGDVLNSSSVMAHYLGRRHPGARLYVVGEKPLRDELRRAGFDVVEDPSIIGWKLDYVVAAFDRTFDYAKLNHAMQAVKRGARFVATNPDRTCPVDEGEIREIPDCAGMIGAIEGVTGVKVEEVVGKPSPLMVEAALAALGGLAPGDCLMAGDRLETDILMGRRAGIATALVLSGISTWEMAEAAPPEERPDYVLETLAGLV
jgi:phosphoglycolate/pyridoxal phosphate phosphatase family enzyme